MKNAKWVTLQVVGEAPWPVDFSIYTGSEMHYRLKKKDSDLY